MRPLGLLAFICCTGATVLAGEAKTDLDRIQGTWEIVSLVEKGKKVAEDETKLLEIVVKGDRLVIKAKGNTLTEYSIKLDEKHKPRAMDMTITDGEDKGKIAPGIYAFCCVRLKISQLTPTITMVNPARLNQWPEAAEPSS